MKNRRFLMLMKLQQKLQQKLQKLIKKGSLLIRKVLNYSTNKSKRMRKKDQGTLKLKKPPQKESHLLAGLRTKKTSNQKLEIQHPNSAPKTKMIKRKNTDRARQVMSRRSTQMMNEINLKYLNSQSWVVHAITLKKRLFQLNLWNKSKVMGLKVQYYLNGQESFLEYLRRKNLTHR